MKQPRWTVINGLLVSGEILYNSYTIFLPVLYFKVLQTHYATLCQNLEPKRHFSYLRSKSILSSDDQERIDSGTTRNDRARAFIDLLLTKGYYAFDELCNSLHEEGTQLFLVTTLNKAYEQEMGKCKPSFSKLCGDFTNLFFQHCFAIWIVKLRCNECESEICCIVKFLWLLWLANVADKLKCRPNSLSVFAAINNWVY